MKKKLIAFLMFTVLVTVLSVIATFAAERDYLWPLPVKLGEYYNGEKVYIYKNGGWGNDRTDHMHQGIDINAKTGTPIFASKSGIARDATGSSQGTCVTIFHGDGYATCYMHMSSMTITDGQRVKQGDLIGYTGNTGSSTSPHLHFEISRVDNDWYYWTYDTIDPESVDYIYERKLTKPSVSMSARQLFPNQLTTFSWNESYGADKYQVVVTKSGATVYNKTTTARSLKTSFSSNGTYQVRVTAIEGATKVVSSAVSFQVSSSLANASVSAPDVKYRGEYVQPRVTVKAGGKTLRSGKDYKVRYSSNKYPGKAKITVTGIGSYSGSKSDAFSIYLTKVSSFRATKRTNTTVSLSWSRPTLAHGYQIYRSTSMNGTYKRIATIKKAGALNYTNQGLKKGEKYYYKIRTYRTVRGKNYYSAGSAPIGVTTIGGVSGLSTPVKVKISDGYLNARSGPSTTRAISGKYSNGTTLTVTAVSGKWLKTSKGWVLSDFVSSGTATVTGSNVNCRAEASTSSKILKELDRGMKVRIYAKKGDWYLTSAGGWVIKDYLA